MAYIEQIEPENADGQLGRIYDAAGKRAGRVYNILRIQSQNPACLQAMLQLYQASTTSPDSPLSRAQREMLAVVVSRTNECHY